MFCCCHPLVKAGINFTGHTEFLAQRTGAALPVMMLQTDNFRVALATTHLPLSEEGERLRWFVLPEEAARDLGISTAQSA